MVDSVRLEAARLKDEGVEMLIALGHYGYEEDMAMAQQGWMDQWSGLNLCSSK